VREHETTFIVQPEISEEGREALLEKLDGVLKKAGTERLFVEDLGKRRLAYDIQEFQKGHYLSLHYLDGGAVVKPLERAMQLEGAILRYLTILVEERTGDVEARKAEGVELEKARHERAVERAAQRAEEEAAERVREKEEAAKRAQEEAANHAREEKEAAARVNSAEEEVEEQPEAAAGTDAASAPEAERREEAPELDSPTEGADSDEEEDAQ